MNPNADKSFAANAMLAVLLLAGFVSVPLWADKGVIFLSSVALVQIVFALSFNVVFGLSGMVSFGHAAYFAIGAYACGLLLRHVDGISIFTGLAAGGLAGGLLAGAIGLVALRRASGNYFAILTLAFAEMLHILIAKTPWFGREDGLTGIRRPAIELPGMGAIDLTQGNAIFYFTLAVSAVLVAGAWVLWHSALGRRLAAVRQEPDRASFLGIDVHRARLSAFTLSGMGAGFAGALYAPLAQLLTPEVAQWHFSAMPILYCLLGGAAIFWGPVAGVVVFLGLEHSTRNIVGLSEVVIGATLLLVVLVFPGGLAGGALRLRKGWKGKANDARTLAAQGGQA
ncbi:MAG: branched-chain amino acid ABC transporter permease [Burkholderiaceae bacterium]|jgi:branched-chain amino acid transport system permease protein|nr:branched-chain amino acid ABC transporter permease [Burkholderiaceae bacterium]